MTLEERMTTIANEQMLMREQHARARARLQDILEALDRMNSAERCCYQFDEDSINEIADLARAGLRET